MGIMNSKQKVWSILSLVLLLLLSISCKQPKGREWDNAYPDESGTLDVDGPPRVRADEDWMDRRTAPDPVDPEKAKEKEKEKEQEKEQTEAPKKDGI